MQQHRCRAQKYKHYSEVQEKLRWYWRKSIFTWTKRKTGCTKRKIIKLIWCKPAAGYKYYKTYLFIFKNLHHAFVVFIFNWEGRWAERVGWMNCGLHKKDQFTKEKAMQWTLFSSAASTFHETACSYDTLRPIVDMQIPAGKHANPWSQKDKFHQLGLKVIQFMFYFSLMKATRRLAGPSNNRRQCTENIFTIARISLIKPATTILN